MLNFLLDVLTEKTSNRYCPVRVLSTIGFFVYLGMSFYELYAHCKDFNLLEMASGMAMILGVVAGGVGYKFSKE